MIIRLIIIYIILFNFTHVHADSTGSDTGYKLPRYVSLKSDNVNLRIGSSTNYPIKLKYIKKNLPVEIIDENENWRKTIDFEGNIGWIHKSLIKGDRYALIKDTNEMEGVYNKPKGKIIGEIGKHNIVRVKICIEKWCLININKTKGWINKEKLWGVYLNERFNVPFYQPLINQLWKLNFF